MHSTGSVEGIGAPLPPNRVGGDNFIRYIGDRLILDFHEGAGTIVRDLSGWGNNLTLAGNENWELRKFSFDGATYFSITDALQTDLNMGLSNFMMGIRIKLNVSLASQPDIYSRVFEKRVSGIAGYMCYLDRGNEYIVLRIEEGANSAYIRISSSTLDDLGWHYLVVFVDRSSSTGLKFYLDGSEITYVTQDDPTPVGSLDNTNPFYLGSDAGVRYINASFDELRVWNFGTGGLYIGPIGILQQYLYHKWNTN